jgi:hypothetical protein
MWMVDPRILCREHLLGEHSELHKHRHSFVKRHAMDKRIKLGQIEPASMKSRHDALVVEMVNRGYNHQSPYEQPDINYLSPEQQTFRVDTGQSLADLTSRCSKCASRIGKL